MISLPAQSRRRRSVRRSAVATTVSAAVAAVSAALGLPAVALAGTPAAAATPWPGFPTLPTLEQQVGQLFMVGISSSAGPTSAELSTLRSFRIGNVMLMGRSAGGVTPTARISATLRAATTQGRIRPYVSTDQEGGLVQVLRGPGFSTMPTALTQGSWSAATLRSNAGTWGRQLAAAGVNLNLAPVLDTVPASQAATNQPIGRYHREYGHTSSHVAASGVAFQQGMLTARVSTAIKHFPGLGRATGNTDVTAGVTDPTTRHDPYLAPFAAGIRAGSPFVMVSTAMYPNIDRSRLAAFSPTVLGTLLRGDLGFHGVIISDDLGTAKSVLHLSPAARATTFFGAGGDMLLTGNAPAVPLMINAVVSAARTSPAFAARIRASVARVLAAKTAAGLLPSTRGDFTGDGVADAALFRPSPGQWWVRGMPPVTWGQAHDVPLSGDFTGDGRADYALYRPSNRNWYVRGQSAVFWGSPGDVPLSADFTGDGRADPAVYRPSTGTWYVRGLAAVTWGMPGDVPLSADFTGDGRADPAVYRPSNGMWYVRGLPSVQYGGATDRPLRGDFNGDSRADLALFQPTAGSWHVRGVLSAQWGTGTDVTVPADYTGDGQADLAVFRPADSTWHVRGLSAFTFGGRGDTPLR